MVLSKRLLWCVKFDFGDGAWSEEGSKSDESKLNFIRGYCPGLLTMNGNKVGAVSEDDPLDGDSDDEDLSKEVFKIQPSVFSCMNMSLLLWVHLQEDSTRVDSTEWWIKLGKTDEGRETAINHRKRCCNAWYPEFREYIGRALGEVRQWTMVSDKLVPRQKRRRIFEEVGNRSQDSQGSHDGLSEGISGASVEL
ncbi:unnamed protein product [Heligmosomoides polygyrus]|uniref:DUF4283 domain-containing protein n=1 Tax=Heligmosomoides polygyrus TaxID=6339 RepID=A0A183GJR7_HELPZ|nr:unnamed protein product [Heligmosomoides polygyrus]